ncbi:MAG TPA: HAD family phosphatase [Myxococcota bacterium]|nr:HAD family phosphatase [Myxococcota bacterium]
MPPVRAVIFDLGGVVIDSPLHAIARYEREIGIPAGVINRVVVDTGPEGAWSRLERGELSMLAFYREFEAELRAAGHAISAATMMARIAECAPRPAMLEAIRRIRAQGLKAGALTNNWVDAEREPTHALHEHFDAFIESSKVGLRKPDPRIYALACEALGALPSEAVFLDDIGRNLKAARALGMRTIKVDAPEPALDELRRHVGFPLS